MEKGNYRLNDKFKPRLYQQTIFYKSIEKNTLVVLPTGLGKTLIAAMLSIYKLNEDPNKKIVFLAPTKPLVIQHKNTFEDCINVNPDEMNIFTGTVNAETRKELWVESKICFMTPQTLQNDIANGLYYLEDASLVIFDEAHRATGNYAYTYIANELVRTNKKSRILAMTASPGGTMEKIEEIMSNLFIKQVEIRGETDKDVKPYFKKNKVKWIQIDLPPKFIEIKSILEKEFKKIITFIKEKNLMNREDLKYVSRMDLLDLNKKIQMQINQAMDFDEKNQLFEIIKILAVGMRISHSLELIETQGLTALSKYLVNCEKDSQKANSSKALRIFVHSIYKNQIEWKLKALMDKKVVHPKIMRLKGILKDFTNENPDSRIIVFAHYRVTVKLIVNFLKENGFTKITEFHGQQSSGRGKGMSQKQQTEIIRDFHEGTFQILVSTSVAEEGLDIGECDLVVFYDVVPSEIRTIQRKGRTGRKREGTVIILMAKNTRDEAYYYAEKAKEARMKETLSKFKQKKYKSLDSFK
ncbi:MAG: DEAD/DEAH box helicase [Candidatus Hodarchaeota archaeon]